MPQACGLGTKDRCLVASLWTSGHSSPAGPANGWSLPTPAVPHTTVPGRGSFTQGHPGPRTQSPLTRRRGMRQGEPASRSPYLSQTAPGGKQTGLWGPWEWQPVHRGPSMHYGERTGRLVQAKMQLLLPEVGSGQHEFPMADPNPPAQWSVRPPLSGMGLLAPDALLSPSPLKWPALD